MHLQVAKRFNKIGLLLSFLIYSSLCCAQPELIIEPDRGAAPILQTIQEAKSSVDLVMYGFTDMQFANALNNANKNNKHVRVLLQHYPYRAETENSNVINYLKNNTIPFVWPDGDFQLTHQKTLLTDNTNAIIMTFNFTHSTFKNERNFALKISDPSEINEIQQVFNADYQHKKINVYHPDLIWSPNNSREKLLSQIQSAHSSLKIYAETISDYQIIGALARAARNGVSVSIITSTHDDKHPAKKYNYLTRAGVNLYFSKHYYIHAKVIIIDNKTAILGSINLTKASIDKNRELAIITRDPAVMTQLKETFDNDWKGKITPIKTAYKLPAISVMLIKEIKRYAHQHHKHKKHYRKKIID
ncbi:MAG: phospholipase D-like domain-containing protein [Gammaproteobacteria bacterium]|nr:phospholipase D-like domain-containing protein [Gammaproteobacteria bacterium]